MIEFRCRFCALGNLSAEVSVLRCPRCDGELFEAQYWASPEPEPHLQPIEQTINFVAEPSKQTTEITFDAGSSPSLNEQTDSAEKDFIFSYEDSAYGIGRPNVECRGGEVAEKINISTSNIRLGQEQLSQNFSQGVTEKKSVLPEIHNTFAHINSLNAQDNDDFNASSFNFLPNPVCAPNAEPQHQEKLFDPPSSTQWKSQSFPEMKNKKQKTSDFSRIQNVDSKMSYACSSHFESHTSMPQSYPESVITKSKLKSTGYQEKNSSPDFLSDTGNSSNGKSLSKDLRSVNDATQQEIHSSDPRAMVEGREKVSAMLEKRSSVPKPKNIFVCFKCYKYFKSESALDAHVQSDCDPNPYKCDQCPLKFKLKSFLRMHQRSHSTKYRFKCDQCGFASNWERALKRHKETCKGNSALRVGNLSNYNHGK